MSRPAEAEIDGYKVSTTRHPPLRGLQLKARVLRLVAPAARGLSAAGDLGELADLELNVENIEKIAPALEALAGAIDPETLPDLVCELLCNTSIIVPDARGVLNRIELNSRGNIDLAFDGRDGLMFRVIAHAAGVNFADFFGGKASGKPLAETPVPSPSS